MNSKTIVLGVSGSIAAYRACDVARELMRAGYIVRVCLTDAAEKFVTPALFEALTGQPCLTSVFDEPIAGRMAHIDWAKEADLVCVVPATANILNKLANGVADDMLTTLVLAFEGPVMVAPAMNPTMYASESVQRSLTALRSDGFLVVEPEVGEVACGDEGQGKLASVSTLVQAIQQIEVHQKQLAGKHVLITSGPTQEAIDDVRYVSNHSSGKMGAALALAASQAGARVTVISGPVAIRYPKGVQVVSVQSAQQMLDAAMAHVPEADIIIGAAAVADYRPAKPHAGKLRRTEDHLTLELVPNPDVLATLAAASKDKAVVLGFAAEPNSDLEVARQKIQKKRLWAIAHNNVSEPGIGFGSENNAVTMILGSGEVLESGVRPKVEVARWILNLVYSKALCIPN